MKTINYTLIIYAFIYSKIYREYGWKFKMQGLYSGEFP